MRMISEYAHPLLNTLILQSISPSFEIYINEVIYWFSEIHYHLISPKLIKLSSPNTLSHLQSSTFFISHKYIFTFTFTTVGVTLYADLNFTSHISNLLLTSNYSICSISYYLINICKSRIKLLFDLT